MGRRNTVRPTTGTPTRYGWTLDGRLPRFQKNSFGRDTATARSESSRASMSRGSPRCRCGECAGCLATECGTCRECLDRPRLGGKGVRKKLCRRRKCQSPQHAGRIHVTAAPAAGVSSASPLPLDAKLASASPAGASAPLAARAPPCSARLPRRLHAGVLRLRFRRLLLLLLRPCLCLRLRHLLVSALGRPRLLLRPPNQPGSLRHVWLWDLGHDCPPDRPHSHPPWRGWPRFLRSITLSQLCPRGIVYR